VAVSAVIRKAIFYFSTNDHLGEETERENCRRGTERPKNYDRSKTLKRDRCKEENSKNTLPVK